MAKANVVTVGVTPTLLYQSDGPDLESVTFDNQGAGNVTMGDKSVVAGAGVALKPANPPQTITMYEDAIYGVVASGTAAVAVLAVLSGSR